MKNKNIWKNVEYPLEIHSDDRGSITDIFYNSKIEHVAVISQIQTQLEVITIIKRQLNIF